MRITYKDGSVEDFFEANDWKTNDYPNEMIGLINRKFDEDGDWDEDEDVEVAILNLNELRCIKLK